jgi:hypothetical protein
MFDKFRSKYPGYHTAIVDPAPPIGFLQSQYDDVENDFDIDDMEYGSNPIKNYNGKIFDNILPLLSDNRLTECHRVMLEIIVFDNVTKQPSLDRLCKVCLENRGECLREKKLNQNAYQKEFELLKNIIVDYI